MKRLAIVLFAAAALAVPSTAQNLSFGHINATELISLMPDRDSAIVRLQTYQLDLEETRQSMEAEYNTKLSDYQRKESTWTPAVREAKEKDIQDLIQRIRQFQQTAEQEMSQMQQMLMQPVYKKATEAIEKVASEKGLIYVFDTSSGALLYRDNGQSLDLLPLVKEVLGIPAEKVAPTQIPTPEAK
jgi:outer membrane protein